jgi:cysteine dioxygenase
VLVWSPGKGSPIHDHGDAHCLMKILKGDLTETRYAFPKQGPSHPLNLISETTHSENEVVYMADELGLHRMSNKGSDFAVSLHCKPDVNLMTLLIYCVYCTHIFDLVYTPPHVARKGCHTFDERTGRKNYASGRSYHSVYGRLLEE